MAVVVLGIGWLLGVWLGEALELSLYPWAITAGTCVIAAVASFRRRTRLFLGLLFAAAVGLGGIRYVLAIPLIDSSHVASFNNTRDMTLVGVIVAEPDIRDRYVNLRLQVELIRPPGESARPGQGEVLVRTSRFPAIGYGSRVEVVGYLESPPIIEEFDYRDYLARQGILSMVAFPELDLLAERQGNPLKQAIVDFKGRAQQSINRFIPEPQAALLSGIVLGNDHGMAEDLVEAFQATGMTHIIAISGFNVAVLIGILMRLGGLIFPHWGTVAVAMFGMALYTILVGAEASVVRAAIMGSIALISNRLLGRPTYAVASLLLAALLMTLFDPFVLWDVGFQLSFAATLGLILYADPLTAWTRDRLSFLPEKGTLAHIPKMLADTVVVTLAAQLLVLPIIVAYFGKISIASLLANVFILPAQPGVMVWGGAAALAGIWLPLLGQVLGNIAWLFLGYTTVLVRLFAAVPGASVPAELNTTGVITIYGLMAVGSWLAMQGGEGRRRIWDRVRPNLSRRLALGAAGISALLVVAWAFTQPDDQLHVVFFDVGQGDAIFIQSPSGRQILVDGGLYPTLLNDRLGRKMPFWDREIDVMVATHPDADHVSGLPGVFDRYRVGLLVTDGEEVGASPIYDEVLLGAEASGTPILPAVAGETIVIEDGVSIEIIHPGPWLSSESRNDSSVCLRLIYGEFTLLLTGDAEEIAEQMMVDSGHPLRSVVFKAGHHGSRSSSNDFFLEAVRPQFIIVSAGEGNRFGHPHPEVLERAARVGAAVLRTDELGTIEITTDGERMWWRVDR